MPKFTLDELKTIMRSTAGVDEQVDIDSDITDIAFEDLGYDSLAVLELAGQVGRQYNLTIPDDAVDAMSTPGAAVKYINEQFAKGGN
ncbi:acyl carrier protein [Kibdelosporangium phytohabitans]|uniref:Carrier domain-containing protein n=1 Tax=Kibdelosporangium phytohabitans TaxID=860235 RepID=A0A0N9I5I4_9PSEU|nr:acyl carrier protein [Kibdelosporangium phytohabitans]ALG10914.1 hypothetical protein AOZ06_32105 [Kibdelosporangium phytohabitans]MBE1462105.1 acyl carrier protein [Kibdelosporangium phytohabitans]